MPTAVLTAEDRNQARKDRRAKAARMRYQANIEESRKRCKSAKQEQRRQDGEEFPTVPGRNTYDPSDYAEEWMLLSSLGMRSDQIIARSRPSREWFVKRVLPLVDRSVCALCGSLFNPQRVHMLTRCSNACTGQED